MSINTFLEYFMYRHKEILGYPYLVNYGKDSKIMKDIATLYGQNKVTQMIDIYLGAVKTDEFLKKTGASVGIFKTQIPKLIMSVSNNEVDGNKGKW